MVKNQKKKLIRKYTTEYLVKDMKCLKLYCEHKEIRKGDVLNQILNKFLANNKEEIKSLMDHQRKIVDSRKGIN